MERHNSSINQNIDDEKTSLLINSNNNNEQKAYSTKTTTIRTNNNSSSNQGISWYFAVFLIVNAALGAGLLNFAKAFNNAGGILAATLIHLALVVVIVGALIILAYCTDDKQSANFQDVIYAMCGKKWQTINSICIILYMFGCCITFFIIIGDQLDQLLACFVSKQDMTEHWYYDRKFTISLTSFIFILPLCYRKRIDFLTYPSMIAVIAIIYVVILIPIKYASLKIDNVIIKLKPDTWTDVFTVIPVICFGYQCHVNAVPIYACLKEKTLKEFSKSITVSLIIVFTAYTLTATFGYLTFGEQINDDLLKSYDSKDASVVIAVAMYLIKTYTSYPLNLFCARTAIEGVWIEVFRLNTDTILRYEKQRRFLIVTIWFMLSLVVALFIPNITLVINYLGALAATFMFIFPGLCLLFYSLDGYNKVSLTNINDIMSDDSSIGGAGGGGGGNESIRKRNYNILTVISVFYITLGVFIMGLVITQSLVRDLKL